MVADRPSPLARARAGLAAAGAVILGAAPHVLHHVGPLAGAAVLAGATGQVLFGVIGLALAIPMLLRMRRRHGSWASPARALVLMTLVYAFSTLVIGPAVTGAGSRPSAPPASGPSWAEPDTEAPAADPSGHRSHHEAP